MAKTKIPPGPGMLGLQGGQVHHQRLVVEKIGDVAEAGFQLIGQRVQVRGFQQQGHQGQVSRAASWWSGRTVSGVVVIAAPANAVARTA